MTEPTSLYGIPVHPVCDLFPLMRAAELDRLAADIETHGLTNPLTVHNGQLVDGRNRILACQRVGVAPTYEQWRAVYHGTQTVAQWIFSVNAERRHLTDDQYVAARVALTAWEDQEAARLNQIAAGKRGAEGGRGKVKTPVTESSQGFPKGQRAPAVRTKIAKQLGVSEHRVQQALSVQKASPELLKQVATGVVKLSAAAKQVKNTTAAKQVNASTVPKKQAPAAPILADLRPIMRPVLEAVDTALSSVATDEQRLALVKADMPRGKPTMEAWTRHLEEDKYEQRKALLAALGNWVEEVDEEDGPGEERAESAEGGIMQPNQDEPFGLWVGEPADEVPDDDETFEDGDFDEEPDDDETFEDGDFDEEPDDDETFEDGDLEEPEVAEEDGLENEEGETRS
jgi:hypothetical protein